MKIFCERDNYKLYEGSMLDMMQVLNPCTVDSIVTDPPYELGFMGKSWDSNGIAFQVETWRKCYQVLKSGGYLLAFGGTRTFHRIACAIEDAGFEIRDTIMWLYGSGFPKSMNIGLAIDKKNGVESKVIGTGSGAAETHTKTLHSVSEITGEGWFGGEYEIRQAQNKWAGWGTALKPAYEPVIVARKPCEGSCVDNVMRYGVGGLNIDGCRIGTDERTYNGMSSNQPEGAGVFRDDNWKPKDIEVTVNGRFPSNVILTYDDTDFQEVCGGMPETKSTGGCGESTRKTKFGFSDENKTGWGENQNRAHLGGLGDEGSAARYYYCAKASKRDRDEGLDAFQEKQTTDGSLRCNEDTARMFGANSSLHRNTHPTVKPTDLMQYLVRLVTPPNGTVLDPFNGSGSTGKAVMYENRDRNAGYKYIGIELTSEYLPIADARIKYAAGDHTPVEYPSEEKPLEGQITFFDLLGGKE